MKICIYIVKESFDLFYPIYGPFVKNSSQEKIHCMKKKHRKKYSGIK